MTAEEETRILILEGACKVLKSRNEKLEETIEALNEQIIKQNKEIMKLRELKKTLLEQKENFVKDLKLLDTKFLLDWSSGDGIEVEVVGYSDIEKLIKNLEKNLPTISEAKKPYKCNIMGIECLFPDKKCDDCIVDKESQIGYCPETQKLIEKYKKDRESTVTRPNIDTEEK